MILFATLVSLSARSSNYIRIAFRQIDLAWIVQARNSFKEPVGYKTKKIIADQDISGSGRPGSIKWCQEAGLIFKNVFTHSLAENSHKKLVHIYVSLLAFY